MTKHLVFMAMTLLCSGSYSVFSATNSTTVGNITWDFNNAQTFGGNGTAKWTNNADYANFNKSGAGTYVNVSDADGQLDDQCDRLAIWSRRRGELHQSFEPVTRGTILPRASAVTF